MKLITYEKNGKRGADAVIHIIESSIDIDTIGEESIGNLRASGNLKNHLVAGYKLLSPMMRPGKILAFALNYQEHIDETNFKFFDETILFEKYTSYCSDYAGLEVGDKQIRLATNLS